MVLTGASCKYIFLQLRTDIKQLFMAMHTTAYLQSVLHSQTKFSLNKCILQYGNHRVDT